MTDGLGTTQAERTGGADRLDEQLPVLVYAGGIYRDTLPLALGMVRPAGFDVRYRTYPVEELLTSPDAHRRHDATEYSLGRLFGLPPDDRRALVGLPIFPARAFRHSAIYVRSSSSLTSPEQLVGKRVGIPRWTQTAVIWTRGIIADRYDVDLHAIRWVITSRILSTSSYREQDAGDASGPEGYDVLPSSSDASLHDQLLAGEIDAVITANPLPTGPGDPFRHLIDNVAEVERDYFVESGVYPIMHAVVVSRSLLEARPEVASALLDAFEESRRSAEDQWGTSTPVPFTGLAWENVYLSDERRLFAGEGWQHGMRARQNQLCLAAFLRYAIDQKICSPDTTLSDLFWTPEPTHDRKGGRG